ncbi:upstream-binding factor 1-like protein 1 isoform X1 [Cricetulus griseus]|uniref:Upstream-binding factor 1-like protein 1 n=1 Tax=Cricetulus griseus TaxID=10029 RepID=G3IMT3_CRIGR|nr:upstream-binding factor 1-like protein 1 isoform X1 [Cricetulus griseus]EGW14243.1 Upstream-binding factor 1-like protein 1 [Cricetulus griseus]
MASFDKQHHWSERDILKLLECMKNNIPSDDSGAIIKTPDVLDWDKVAFKDFSGEVCKQKWMQISHNLSKSGTLSELVLEASELIKEPRKTKTVKKHPDFPKRPLTAYLRFYKEQRAKYSKMYPKYNNVQLTKFLAEKYKQLPEEIKEKYIQDFQKEKQDFQEKLIKPRENHPSVERSKKSVVHRNHHTAIPKKSQGDTKHVKTPLKTEIPKTFPPVVKFRGEPKKPPMNGYHKFHQDSWSSQELHHLPLRQRWVEISRRWQRISQNMREQYNIHAEALQKQYWVEMELWLKGLSPEEYSAYKETRANYGKGKNFAKSRDISANGQPTHQ